MALAACSSGVEGSEGLGDGVSPESVTEPWSASDDQGEKPDLPRVIGYAQDSPREYQQAIADGLQQAADDTDLELQIAQSDGDAQKQVQNMNQFLVSGVGSLVTLQVNPQAQAPVMEEAMGKGVAVQSVIFGPSTVQANGTQYQMGEELAKVAQDWIESELGGKAKVAILNLDSLPAVRPRFQAIRDVLAEMPGVEVVADVEPSTTDSDGGFKTMSTLIQQTPDIEVVLGVDATSLGALAALEAAHKATDRTFIGGFDGEKQALDEIASGGPFKATVTTQPSIMAYTMGRFAADWLDGKTIPQGICIKPRAISGSEDVEQYRADEADPGSVWDDPDRLSEYVTFSGAISYETRSDYVNGTWVPESC